MGDIYNMPGNSLPTVCASTCNVHFIPHWLGCLERIWDGQKRGRFGRTGQMSYRSAWDYVWQYLSNWDGPSRAAFHLKKKTACLSCTDAEWDSLDKNGVPSNEWLEMLQSQVCYLAEWSSRFRWPILGHCCGQPTVNVLLSLGYFQGNWKDNVHFGFPLSGGQMSWPWTHHGLHETNQACNQIKYILFQGPALLLSRAGALDCKFYFTSCCSYADWRTTQGEGSWRNVPFRRL